MAKKGNISPFLGIWTPNILLIVTGFILYYFSSSEKSINWNQLYAPFRRIKDRWRANRIKKSSATNTSIKKWRFFNIIDLYVVKKLLFTFTLIFLSLIFIFYIIQLLEIVDEMVDNNIAFIYGIKHVFFKTPEIISFVLPISLLTSVLLTFSIMSKNNEILAVQVSGISLQRLSLPAIILGIIFSFVYFWVQETITPKAELKAQQFMNIIKNIESPKDMEIKKNWVIGENNQIYFNSPDTKHNRYLNFNIIQMDDNYYINKIIHAKYARWKSLQDLVLTQGIERTFQKDDLISSIPFKRKEVSISGGRNLFTQKIISSKYLNISGLKKFIKYLKDNKANPVQYEAKLFHKYAYPLSGLVMVLIAIPFSFMMGKKGTIYGIGIAVAISMIFWFTFALFSALGTNDILSPFISGFAPIFIFMAISIYLFVNIKT